MATAVRGVFAALARSDADLLRRFTSGRDEAAFTELVRRHGPLVLGVCRRVVGDLHLADDAFQAAFVVLARKAGELDAGRPLGPWLYGVAFRVALRARTMIGRRRKRETLAATVPDRAGVSHEPNDLAAVVDEEIARLSAVCREAVVLCEMQGVSRKDAAKRLGVAEGTLSSRLAAARKTLAERLRKRGVALGAGIFSTTFVPTDLLAGTVAVSTGKVELSPHLLRLIEGATHMALLSKLKLAAVAVAFVVLTAGGFGVWQGGESAAAPVPKAERDDGLIWTWDRKTGTLTAFAPDGTKKREVELKHSRNYQGFSRDGDTLLFLAKNGQLTDDDEGGLTLHVGKPDDLVNATDTGIAFEAKGYYFLTRDKKRVVRYEFTQNGRVGANPQPVLVRHTVIDLKDRKETALELSESVQIVDETADGKEWIGMQYNSGDDPNVPGYRYLRLPKSGDRPIPLCDTHQFLFFVPSPDVQSYLGIGVPLPPKGELKSLNLYHLNPATGKATELEQFADTEQRNLLWSPDGKRYAVKKLGDADVYAADIDGKNRKKLFAIPDAGPETFMIGWFPTAAKAPDPRRRNAPVPKTVPPEGVILVTRMSHKEPDKLVEVLDAAGKSRGHLKLGELFNVQQTRVSPDGRRLAFTSMTPRSSKDPRGLYAYPEGLYVVDLPLTGVPKEPVLKGLIEPSFAWAADGKSLFVSSVPPGTDLDQDKIKGQTVPRKTIRFDVTAKTEKEVKLPEFHAVQDVSADGQTLLTRTKMWHPNLIAYSTHLVPLDTLKPKLIGAEEDGFAEARFSPDGTRVLGTKVKYTKSKEPGLFVADVAKGKVEAVPLKDVAADKLDSVAWAPDGKRVAVLWRGPAGGRGAPGGAGGPPGGGADAHRLSVMDADGSNAKTIREFPANDWQYRVEWADPKLAADNPTSPPDGKRK